MSYSYALDRQAMLSDFWASGEGSRWAEGYFGKIMASRQAAADRPEKAAETIGMIAMLSADRGTTFYWSPEMASMLAGVVDGVPSMTLKPDLIPASLGFVWFGKPLPMPKALKGYVAQDIVALSWAVICNDEDRGKFIVPSPDTRVDDGETLGLVFYSRIDGAPGIYPLAFWYWKIGETIEIAADTTGVETPAQLTRLRYVAALLSIMDQRIVVTRKERADRATRKRMERAGWTHEQLVQVIQLRRAENHAAHRESSGEPVEWSCSWVVRGHWRQQACGPNHSERRPVFVLPHVKGPDDKPLKPSAERVFAVVR